MGLQTILRDRVNQSGAFHLVQTVLNGQTYLRTTLINPHTTLEDLAALLEALRTTQVPGV